MHHHLRDHRVELTELTYTVGVKKQNRVEEFLAEIRRLNGGNKITLIAGYNTTDL